MSRQMRIPSTAIIPNVEASLQKIAVLQQETDLLIPHHLKHDDLSGHASTIQLIATWSQSLQAGDLRTYVPPNDAKDEILNRLVGSDHGLVGILMAKRVVDRSGTDITRAARTAAIQRLQRINQTSYRRRGSSDLILAADHTSQRQPMALYATANRSGQPEVEVGGQRMFGAVARRMVDTSTVGQSRHPQLIAQTETIAKILKELFSNTHDWARNDAASGNDILPSVRAIRAEGVSYPEAKMRAIAHGSPPLGTYLMGQNRHQRSDDLPTPMHRFLEISVLDTGPGLTARSLRQQGLTSSTTIDDEYTATLRCLSKHSTTSTNLDTIKRRGIGLHLVMECLTQLHGFMRIRTGRLALYRNFRTNPYLPDTGDAPSVFDWETNSRVLTQHSWVSGTLISILLPTYWETEASL